MNIADFRRVEALALRREHLAALQHARIEITIAGEYQSRTIVDTVAPSVRLALRREIQDIDVQLRALGVRTD